MYRKTKKKKTMAIKKTILKYVWNKKRPNIYKMNLNTIAVLKFWRDYH